MSSYSNTPDKLCRKCGANYSRESWLAGLNKPTVGDVLIYAWKQLAYGCDKHPRYRASGVNPKPKCPRCVELWDLRRDIESLEIAKAREYRAGVIAEKLAADERSEYLERYANSHQ